MIDYALKSKVMKMGLDLLQKDVSKSVYAYNVLVNDGLVCNHKYEYKQALELDYQMQNEYPIEWKEAQKINHAYYQRVRKLKNRIATLLQKPCLFLTFTFDEIVLQKTNADTRRQKVIRYLKSYNVPYVANIDFGKQNGREHYHAIIQTDNVDYSLYDYGALNGKKIVSTSDNVKLAKYISKLTNHAIKDTTKRNSIIYSR